MVHFKNNRSSTIRTIKITLTITAFIFCFALGFLFGANGNETRKKLNIIFSADINSNQDLSITNKHQIIDSFSYGHNSTHLWSMPLADQNYFRLAHLLPCQTVSYTRGPQPATIDSCDHSSTNEYSIPNLLQAQKWLYEHQHPADCTNKRFAIIHKFAGSGFGSTIHQIAWAFGIALADDRIAVYQTPGNWLYGDCNSSTPDCLFLPISNCSVPSKVDGHQTIRINADMGYWTKPVNPSIFQNRTFNWYRAQLVFYLMRFTPETLAHAQNTVSQYFNPPSVDRHHPYIAVYVRRSDKVKTKEMSEAYTLKQYFDLFDGDARRANIRTVYINSEDEQVFNEFIQINKEKEGYYKLLSIKAARNVVYSSLTRMSRRQRGKIVLEFLTDLFIEVNADLHVGTLTSNWCRLVDELRLVLGKTIPFYTPEKRYFMDGIPKAKREW